MVDKTKEDKRTQLNGSIAHYREMLVERFGTNAARAIRALSPAIDEETVRRLLKPEYTGKFGEQTVKRLEWYFHGGQERDAYFNIMQKMELNPASIKTAHDEWLGEYNYFRYFARSGDKNDARYNYGGGRINIFIENKLPVFEHWSHNHNSKTPEHRGYVYLSSSQLFMLGVGNNTMRLGIAHAVKKPKVEPIVGLVVSQRKDAPYTPFSARFVMVNKENVELIANLSDSSPIHDTSAPGHQATTTVGEKAFHEATGGAYAYFMLASH